MRDCEVVLEDLESTRDMIDSIMGAARAINTQKNMLNDTMNNK